MLSCKSLDSDVYFLSFRFLQLKMNSPAILESSVFIMVHKTFLSPIFTGRKNARPIVRIPGRFHQSMIKRPCLNVKADLIEYPQSISYYSKIATQYENLTSPLIMLPPGSICMSAWYPIRVCNVPCTKYEHTSWRRLGSILRKPYGIKISWFWFRLKIRRVLKESIKLKGKLNNIQSF